MLLRARTTPALKVLPALLVMASTAAAQEPLALDFPGEALASFARDIDGDGNEEWIVAYCTTSSNGASTRQLRLFRLDGDPPALRAIATDTALPESACAIACADVLSLPGSELLVFDAEGLRIHPLEPAPTDGTRALRWHAQGRTALEAQSFFDGADSLALVHWPHVLFTDDGGVEVLAPLAFGYARFRAGAASQLQLEQRLDLRALIAARRVWDSSLFTVERELPLPSSADLDGDGRCEIVLEGAGDGVLWTFDAGGRRVRIDVEPAQSGAGKGALEKCFRRFADLDGDRKADLVSWVVRGEALRGFAFETEVSIRLGLGTNPPTFGTAHPLRFRGAGSVAALPDLDGDGKLDLVFVRCENPAAAIVGGLATLRFGVYLAREAGGFPSQPEIELSARMPLSALDEADLRSGRLPDALRFDRDFDGDGTLDLLQLDPRNGASIRRGALERREHDGRAWTTYRLLEPPWFTWSGEASFATGVVSRGGQPFALVVPFAKRALILPLPSE